MMAGLHVGCTLFRSATSPLTWGVAIEVPDLKANASGLAGTPARMLSPGASRSGLRTPGLHLLKPRPEKSATVGAGDESCVPTSQLTRA